MDFDFDQISDMLGSMSEEELQNLQDAAQSLFSSFGGAGEEEPDPAKQQQQSSSDGGLGGMFTPEMLAKLSKMMSRMNGRDPRSDLIMALKPHLSRRRQHRAEHAVQMMKMLELIPTLQETMK